MVLCLGEAHLTGNLLGTLLVSIASGVVDLENKGCWSWCLVLMPEGIVGMASDAIIIFDGQKSLSEAISFFQMLNIAIVSVIRQRTCMEKQEII